MDSLGVGVEIDAYLTKFGLSSFRPGQREVIATVLSGRDCLCVMPTGGGKSLCYQLPALALEGLTLVVSPLIALMKDQVDQLHALGLPVTFINSTLSLEEQHERLDRMAAGEYRLVYVVPERFRSTRFLDAVREVGLKLLAVDEAHCISEWGHDFRPDYARLGRFRHSLGDPTTIALTATATDAVRRDIVEQLDLNDPRVFITGFARPNLFYEVQLPRTERQKMDLLVQFLRETPGSGIIYASTRKKCEEVAQAISEQLRRGAVVYHAGMVADQRHAAQDAFMQGRSPVVVATNAFGMGIDKSDVRFVVHYNLPGTLEAYYQEAGRAGRDGSPSRCLLLYHASDRYIQEFFIESAYPARENIKRVYDFLLEQEADPIELTQQDLKEELGLPIGAEGVGTCEQLLESAGVLERLMLAENMAAVRLDSDLPTLVDLLPKQATVRRRVLRAVERLVGPRRNEMVQFAPRRLSQELEMDQTSLTHALRELNELDVFTYVPPFRGRALRMVRRDQPFEALEIDFETLERRKEAEYEKLKRVIYFATSGKCRQQDILEYFGDDRRGACGHCDNCRRRGISPGTPPGEDHRQAGSEDSTESPDDEHLLRAVRIVLSGVARTQARVRCGKHLIAQMLCGSESAKMEKLGLKRLSTFGLLKHLKQPQVAALIDGLITSGHLEQTDVDSNRPVLQLTAQGDELMKGKMQRLGSLPIPADLLEALGVSPKASQGRKPQEDPAEKETSSSLPPPDPDLLARLRKWRQTRAQRSGVPAYMVLANAALEALAQRRPQSRGGILEIKGIGKTKLEQYGDELLELLTFADNVPAVEQNAPPPAASTSPTKKPGKKATEPPPWELVEDFSCDNSYDQEPFLGDDRRGPPHPDASPARPGNADTAQTPPSDPTPSALAISTNRQVQDEPASPPPAPSLLAGPPQPKPGQVQPTHYWTWRLLSTGFSADDCATIRGLGRDIILGHALWALEEGWPVQAAWCLSGELLTALETLVGKEHPTQIRPLLAQLPRGTRYEEVELFLKCREAIEKASRIS